MKSLREFYHHPEVLRGETESFSAESVLCACVLSRFSRANSLQPYGLKLASLPYPWDSPDIHHGLPVSPAPMPGSRRGSRTYFTYCHQMKPEDK